MYLEEFFDYKNQLMKDLLSSEAVCELLRDEDVADGESLAYKRIFPYEYLPETVEYGGTYICFDVDIESVQNGTYLYPTISIWVFSHKSKLRLPDGGGVRTDKLCCEICKVINGSRYYGLGELNIARVRRFAPMTDYQGKSMVFSAKEFNRLAPTGKPIPANRKIGQ